MSRSWNLRHIDGDLLEPDSNEWDIVQRRERLYSDRYMSGGIVRREQPGHLFRKRPVSRRRDVQPLNRELLEPTEVGRVDVQRRERVHTDGHMSGGIVRREQPGG